MSKRQEHRQHSKSTLLKATELMFRERYTLVETEARKWKRRLLAAAGAAFAVGAAVGAAVGRLTAG
jgi:hypothetical protein